MWVLAIIGVLLTSLYTFRLIFLVFFGDAKSQVSQKPGFTMKVPAIVLAILSIVGGFVNTPSFLGNIHRFSDFLQPACPQR